MLPRCVHSLCLQGGVLLAAVCTLAQAQQTPGGSVQPIPTFVADGLGKGAIPLDGPWQFHLGDDLAWANPAFDDSQWEQLSADKPWGEQGHFAYTGFAWYRRSLDITPAPGASPDVALFVPRIDDAYEIYWNGELVGGHGHLPPHPIWYRSSAQTFGLGPARRGVLAVRVWTAFLSSNDSGLGGGFGAPMVIGSPQAVGALKAQADYRWLRSKALFIGLYSLFGLLGLLGFGLWLRDRSQTLLFWAACYFVTIFGDVVVGNGLSPWPTYITGSLSGIFIVATNISLWYLTCWLLDLRGNQRLMRLTRIAAFILMTACLLDAVDTCFIWRSEYQLTAQIIDAILTPVIVPLGLWNLVPVAVAVFGRRKLHHSRWLFACITTFSSTFYMVFVASSQGNRFTHWTFDQILWAPIFHVFGSAVNMQTVADSCVLVSLVYAIYRSSQDTSNRNAALEREFQNARELQQILIPESLPEIPGFVLTSAYKPALEVGGDFFQIVPLDGSSAGSTLIILGDVSGKGLKAAMAVSLIVGAARTLAEATSSPAEILAGLNRRLEGRLRGGFATAIALRMDPDGRCTMASAGHLAPFLNGEELSLPGALPLGVVSTATYEESTLKLEAGDYFALYTDGLLEARSASKELYGFDRLRALFKGRPEAAGAAEAAVAFGQDDDITVLTFTRLAGGEQSNALLACPAVAEG